MAARRPAVVAPGSTLRPGSRRAFLRAVAAVLGGGAASACGYTLAGRGSFLPAYIRTIGVPTFTNRTPIFNLETLVTQKVRAEFIGRGKYQILPQATGVDGLLNGDVSAVTVTPVGFNPQQNNLATSYSVTMTARIEFRDQHENKVLWENPGVMFRQDYPATSGRNSTDPVAFFQQDASALERMSSEFARTIVSSILEAF
ncbi:MAG TPA: LPS assembly lipoprotein LptE [Vicinamibacterales bacterium]|nr:LPS assembly lipoprotein LptE [Vicinamibacterales bacterium]